MWERSKKSSSLVSSEVTQAFLLLRSAGREGEGHKYGFYEDRYLINIIQSKFLLLALELYGIIGMYSITLVHWGMETANRPPPPSTPSCSPPPDCHYSSPSVPAIEKRRLAVQSMLR